ncbi:hypothetical protein K2173_026280 [Erythroxylum novogranatense]|uniref:Uncharacterized protein n=1 Tax=Erythroxylum novogranatense TaxID=1862640 RepID=A0AAV8SBP3_9ROSI|nr:hypothetical protein K2173_026280 [Erythroxylum novogranatense]
MARSSPLLATSLILLSLLVVASADYGNVPKPDNIVQPQSEINDQPIPIAIEGVILCKSGSSYLPVQGATSRIKCLAVDDRGYEVAPFAFMSSPSDENGYFFATLLPSQIGNHLKLSQCKAFLHSSPLETCSFATDANGGLTGALLSAYRILNEKKMKLFTVGPFFYSQEPVPVPDGY